MIVKTASGTVYDIDQEADTVTRYPSEEASQLRLDGTKVFLLATPEPEVGFPMLLKLDVVKDNVTHTWRLTTPVTSIEESDGE